MGKRRHCQLPPARHHQARPAFRIPGIVMCGRRVSSHRGVYVLLVKNANGSITMTGRTTLVAAVLIAAILATSARADEPAAYAARNPDRDVLNGGAFTPASKLSAADLQAANAAAAGLAVKRRGR
jgi:hypothetical protein